VGWFVQSKSLFLGSFVTEIFLILMPALVYVKCKKLVITEALRFRKVPLSLAVRGALLGIFALGIVAIVDDLISFLPGIFGKAPPESYWTKFLPKTLSELPGFLVFFGLLSGCEEVLFRGSRIRRNSLGNALWIV